MTERYTVTLLQDGDDVIMPIPDEIWERLDLDIGNTIVFEARDEGGFTIRKATEDEAVD